MPTIRISGGSWERLKAWAEPLEDSADDALKRVLEAAESHRNMQDQRSQRLVQRPPSRSAETLMVDAGFWAKDVNNTKLLQKELRQFLLDVIYEEGGSMRPRDLRRKVRERMTTRFLNGGVKVLSGEFDRWWNAACRARNELVKEGYFRNDSPRGVWALSEKGVALVESRLKESSGNFADHLRAMPDVGEDSDFER